MNTKQGLINNTLCAQSISWRDYLKMTKPTISLLVVVTTVPGLLIADFSLPTLRVLFATFLGTALSSASAGVFNQIVDSRLDQIMARTRGRPIPTGSIPTFNACLFGVILGVLGTGILCAEGTPLAAGIALGANLFYVIVYTWFLKMRTVQNIVIGGAAGAVGPLIGSAMVNGHTIGWGPILLATIIFLWTPPHFWALAIKYKDDYAKAGVPMYPVVKGMKATRSAIWWYTLSLLPAVVALFFVGAVSIFGLGISLLVTGIFCYYSWQLYKSEDDRKAMPVFHFSCLYLFLLFGCISADLYISLL